MWSFGTYLATDVYSSIVASKNHKHSVNNPYSQFREGWSEEQVLNASRVTKQLTKFMCSPTSVLLSISYPSSSLYSHWSPKDGAACAIIASEDFVRTHNLENQAIEIIAMALTTDGPETYDSRSPMEIVGYGMTQACAESVFQAAGFANGEGRDQVGVVELHDCFAANEVCAALRVLGFYCPDLVWQLLTYSALGLCPPGEAYRLVERGDNTVQTFFVVTTIRITDRYTP